MEICPYSAPKFDEKTSRAEGHDRSPKWPAGAPAGADRRDGKKTETYYLHVKDKDGKPEKVKVYFKVWQKYKPKDKVVLKKSAMGELTVD